MASNDTWTVYFSKFAGWVGNEVAGNTLFEVIKKWVPKMTFDKAFDIVKEKVTPEQAEEIREGLKANVFGIGLADEQIATSLVLLLGANLSNMDVSEQQYHDFLQYYAGMEGGLRGKLRNGLAKETTDEKRLVLIAQIAKLPSDDLRAAALSAFTEPTVLEMLDKKLDPFSGSLEALIDDRLKEAGFGKKDSDLAKPEGSRIWMAEKVKDLPRKYYWLLGIVILVSVVYYSGLIGFIRDLF